MISPEEPADLGIFAIIVPASILSLSLTEICAPTGTLNTFSSFLDKIVMEGFNFLFLLSMITFSLCPVCSSDSTLLVNPSSMSLN